MKIRSIILAMVLTMVMSAGFQISSYRSARWQETIASRDAHVRDVLTVLVALRSAVQDAEVGRNGYLRLDDDSDLRTYRESSASIPVLLRQALELTAGDPEIVGDSRRLGRLADDELKDLDAGLLGSGAGPSEELRLVLDGMISAAENLRAQCVMQTHAAASDQARWLVIAGLYRLFILVAGCGLIMHQQAQQRRADRLRRQSEELFRNAFDHAATGMILADEQGRWMKANQAMCELVGYGEDQLLQAQWQTITPAEDLAQERLAIEELRSGRAERHQSEMRYIHKDGHTVWALVTKSLVRDEQGRAQTFISQVQDVTERKQAEDRLRHLSLHDGLTGLPNRLLLDERLRRGIERANQDADFRLAVLFLDLDRFKQINDSLGHAAGDKLLVTVAQRLRHCVRGHDSISRSGTAGDENSGGAGNTVARLAGDEFTIVLEGFRTAADAERVAERILRALAKPMDLGGKEICTSASIGIVHAPQGRYAAAAQMMADADAALYKAKAAGRGCYALFDADAQEPAQERLRLAGELRRAIEQEQFVLHFQPIISLFDGRVAGFKAVPHWDHCERGLLGPEKFLDFAEEAGLTVPLGNWILQRACRQLEDWAQSSASQVSAGGINGAAPPFLIVPLSHKQLLSPELLQVIRNAKDQPQDAVAGGGLRVTVAESSLLGNPQAIQEILAELRSVGVQVWLDNFGSGVSSLHCMRSAALDGVKIDACMVASANGRRDDAAIIHSVLELARNLGLAVIADGLETADQLVLLQAMGCGLGQGPYFGPPIPQSGIQIVLDAQSNFLHARSA